MDLFSRAHEAGPTGSASFSECRGPAVHPNEWIVEEARGKRRRTESGAEPRGSWVSPHVWMLGALGGTNGRTVGATSVVNAALARIIHDPPLSSGNARRECHTVGGAARSRGRILMHPSNEGAAAAVACARVTRACPPSAAVDGGLENGRLGYRSKMHSCGGRVWIRGAPGGNVGHIAARLG